MRLKTLVGYLRLDAVPGFNGRMADPRRLYLPELTGLRGIAILMVLTGHLIQRIDRFSDPSARSPVEQLFFYIFSIPFAGCPLFFCISGYTMYRYIDQRNNKPLGRQKLIEFAYRRSIRLVLPYYFVLISTFIFIKLLGYEPAGTHQFHQSPSSLPLSLLASLAFSHTLFFGTFPRLFPPGWFIEVQVQFYIIGSFIWFFSAKIPVGPLRLALNVTVLVALTAASLLVIQLNPRFAHSIVIFLPYFWVGAVIADLHANNLHDRFLFAFQAGWPLGWLGVAVMTLFSVPFCSDAIRMPVILLSLGVIICSSFGAHDNFRRALRNRWLARVGVASYSIYLIHLQTLQVVIPKILGKITTTSLLPTLLVCAILGALIVMVVALAFYWLIERPWVAIAGQFVSPPAYRTGAVQPVPMRSDPA